MTERKLGSGDYVEYEVDGTVLKVLGEEHDIAALQRDSQVIKDIRIGDAFAATIEIPPKKYKQVEGAMHLAESGENEILLEAEPLDMEAVVITLWPVVKNEEKSNEEDM